MASCPFRHVVFVKSATKPEEYPRFAGSRGKELPEIAVAGRSNVGKSSLFNHLFRKKDLVRVSNSPGKTQLINFFCVDDQVVLVDLPGYGYARVTPEVKKAWGPMIENYLKERSSLKLILFLLDIRREPSSEDLAFYDWLLFYQKTVILVLTKVDKVSAAEKQANTKKILEAFPSPHPSYVHYSTTKNIGRQELIHKMQERVWG